MQRVKMSTIKRRLSIYLEDERGAGMVEYALLVSLIGILLIATLIALAGGISTAFCSVVTDLDPNATCP